LYFPWFAKNTKFLNKKTGGKKPEIGILFFNFSETTLFLKFTCTHTHNNINLFLREIQNVENRKPNYFIKSYLYIPQEVCNPLRTFFFSVFFQRSAVFIVKSENHKQDISPTEKLKHQRPLSKKCYGI
jgi:hypothetical protein